MEALKSTAPLHCQENVQSEDPKEPLDFEKTCEDFANQIADYFHIPYEEFLAVQKETLDPKKIFLATLFLKNAQEYLHSEYDSSIDYQKLSVSYACVLVVWKVLKEFSFQAREESFSQIKELFIKTFFLAVQGPLNFEEDEALMILESLTTLFETLKQPELTKILGSLKLLLQFPRPLAFLTCEQLSKIMTLLMENSDRSIQVKIFKIHPYLENIAPVNPQDAIIDRGHFQKTTIKNTLQIMSDTSLHRRQTIHGLDAYLSQLKAISPQLPVTCCYISRLFGQLKAISEKHRSILALHKDSSFQESHQSLSELPHAAARIEQLHLTLIKHVDRLTWMSKDQKIELLRLLQNVKCLFLGPLASFTCWHSAFNNDSQKDLSSASLPGEQIKDLERNRKVQEAVIQELLNTEESGNSKKPSRRAPEEPLHDFGPSDQPDPSDHSDSAEAQALPAEDPNPETPPDASPIINRNALSLLLKKNRNLSDQQICFAQSQHYLQQVLQIISWIITDKAWTESLKFSLVEAVHLCLEQAISAHGIEHHHLALADFQDHRLRQRLTQCKLPSLIPKALRITDIGTYLARYPHLIHNKSNSCMTDAVLNSSVEKDFFLQLINQTLKVLAKIQARSPHREVTEENIRDWASSMDVVALQIPNINKTITAKILAEIPKDFDETLDVQTHLLELSKILKQIRSKNGIPRSLIGVIVQALFRIMQYTTRNLLILVIKKTDPGIQDFPKRHKDLCEMLNLSEELTRDLISFDLKKGLAYFLGRNRGQHLTMTEQFFLDAQLFSLTFEGYQMQGNSTPLTKEDLERTLAKRLQLYQTVLNEFLRLLGI